MALASTLIFNVPINLATGHWDANNPPEEWKRIRNRWEFFQGVRSWLHLIGFVLLCAAYTIQLRSGSQSGISFNLPSWG